ncbi:MAG: copper transporter [Thermoleophilaceae bacterium]
MVDFRYHALSLVAVFLALGIGIVLGVTVGDSLVSEADQNLRDSLRDDVTEAREDIRNEQDLSSRREEVIEDTAPIVAAARLAGLRVALVSFGEVPAEVADSVDEAAELGGGELARTVELTPPDQLRGRPRAVRRRAARRVERRLLGFDRVVIYRVPPPEDEGDEERGSREALLEGALRSLRRPVGVETLGTDPSQVGWYQEEEIASVDNVDTPAGQLGLVLLLADARPEGSYGYKDSAERALPDLSD